MDHRRRVILITDGDEYARKSLEIVAKEIGGRCISMFTWQSICIKWTRNYQTN